MSQFFVVLPETIQETIDTAALTAYLERFFPRYTFVVDRHSPFAGDDFGLIPVAGRIGEGQGAGMFRPAPRADVLAIIDALRAYNDGSKTKH